MNERMNIKKLKAQLYISDALRDEDVIQEGVVERIKPDYADSWPFEIHPRLRRFLADKIDQPYQHQAEAIEFSLQGKDVVLESPTASGKTYAFTVPMLDSLMRNPHSRALMIYPMNALSFDQFDQISEICEPFRITVDTYTGGKTAPERKILREKPPQILLTNPEYLNTAFLGWRERHWRRFLSNLNYLVIDEMHLYRGYFGSNMALLLRRFFLYLNRIGASPRVFLSTATCANPDEHAKNLTGRKTTLVQPRNKMGPKRHFIFVKPDLPVEGYMKYFRRRIEKTAIALLKQEKRALIFGPSIRFLEEAFRNCKRIAHQRGLDASLLAIYHAKIPDYQKHQTQEDIKAGNVQVVFTTNALEVGLDIGGLDGIVMAGFPSNIMSAWQQIGRAGRSWQSEAFVLFFAMNDPIDLSIVGNLPAFLARGSDELVADPGNERLIQNHMASLKDEATGGILPSDAAILGQDFYDAAKDDTTRLMHHTKDRASPQWRLGMKGLRGDNNKSYELDRYGEIVGKNIPEIWRFQHAYQDAILTFSGERYCVFGRIETREERKILLEEAPDNMRTKAALRHNITAVSTFDSRDYNGFSISYGEVDYTIKFEGYDLVDDETDTVLERAGESDYYGHDNLHAVWIKFHGEHHDIYTIFTLLQILRLGTRYVIPVERFDTSAFPNFDINTVYIYENYSGGIGIVKKLFHIWDKALRLGCRYAESCPYCYIGCPACIQPPKSWDLGNISVDKKQGIALAQKMLRTASWANRFDKPDIDDLDADLIPF